MAEMIYANDLKQAMEDAGMLDYVKAEVVYKSAWGVPIVDAEEVVRCKDCKHLMTYNDGTYDCKYLVERMFAEGELNNKPNDFCCWGVRKDEAEDG